MLLPKAILVDLDDTILAFEHGADLDACWKKACSNSLPTLTAEAMNNVISAIKKQAKWYWSDADRHRVGRFNMEEARRQIIKAALEAAGLQEDHSIPYRIAVDYGQLRDEAITLYPGALEALDSIRALGIKLALITNGSSQGQRYKINRFQLSPFFDNIHIEEEFGAGKPDPSIYKHAVNLLGVQPDETWMIGDNFEWEITAPQKLGIKGIWINPRELDAFSLYNTQPYKSIKTLRDVVQLLK